MVEAEDPLEQKTSYKIEALKGPLFVTSERPSSYISCNEITVQWNSIENYQLNQKLGCGAYSEVFHGVNLTNNQDCVLKVLKPVKIERSFREIKVLQTLYGGPNIVKLYDVLRDPVTRTPVLVYEYMPNIETRIVSRRFTNMDCRLYAYKVFQALAHSHENGIMHRDLKPLNMVINHENRELRLIDWGLADFYIPEKSYSTSVGTRYFEAPELLLKDRKYNFTVDIWSVGCILAAWIFKMDKFMRGKNTEHGQIMRIVDTLGSQELYEYLRVYKLSLPKGMEKVIKNTDPLSLDYYINENNYGRVSQDGLDLLEKIFVYDKFGRISAKQALEHPFFEPIRELEKCEDNLLHE